MALVFECTSECARNPLDTADIVRDGDLSTTTELLSCLGLPSDPAHKLKHSNLRPCA